MIKIEEPPLFPESRNDETAFKEAAKSFMAGINPKNITEIRVVNCFAEIGGQRHYSGSSIITIKLYNNKLATKSEREAIKELAKA